MVKKPKPKPNVDVEIDVEGSEVNIIMYGQVKKAFDKAKEQAREQGYSQALRDVWDGVKSSHMILKEADFPHFARERVKSSFDQFC